MKSLKTLFLPKHFFTLPVFISIYSWLNYVHLLDFTNNQGGRYLTRIVILTLLFLFTIGLLFIVSKLIVERVSINYAYLVFFAFIIIIGGLRGYLLDYYLLLFSVTEVNDAGFRIASSIANFSISALLATIAVGRIREHAQSVQKLMTDQYRLAYVEMVTKENLDEFEEKQVEPIKKQLLSSLKLIKTQSVDQALLTIRKTIDEIVQPLSRNLEELISNWNPPEVKQTELKIDWKKAISTATRPAEVNVKLTPVVLSLIGTPTMVNNYGLITGLIVIIQSLLTGYFLYGLVKIVISKLFKGSLGYLLILLTSGLIQGLLSLIWTYSIDSSFAILILTPAAALVSGFFISLNNSATNQALGVAKNIEKTTKDLSWGVSRIRNEQHQRSRNLGRKLHGEIQAQFASAFLIIQNNQNDPAKAKAMVIDLASGLEKDVEKLSDISTKNQKLDEMIEKLKQTWQGVAVINFEANQEVINNVDKDNLCSTALLDIIPELCFNSIKHGQASEVEVSLTQINPKTILLQVKNNGVEGDKDSQKGLGTKLLDECAISWHRNREKELIITSAEFAISA
jgi:two-component sensor histidine kinase